MPTPAFALVLYRLAKRLGGGYYGDHVWGGIGHGGEARSATVTKSEPAWILRRLHPARDVRRAGRLGQKADLR